MKKSTIHVMINIFYIALAFIEHYVFKNEFDAIFTFLLAITANLAALFYYWQTALEQNESATDEA